MEARALGIAAVTEAVTEAVTGRALLPHSRHTAASPPRQRQTLLPLSRTGEGGAAASPSPALASPT